MKISFFIALVYLLVQLSISNSEKVEKRDKILCVVLAKLEDKKEALSVRETWGRKCDNLVFVSDSNDASLLPTGVETDLEKRMDSYIEAYEHVYNNYENSASWILTIPSESFLEMDYVRNLLSNYNKNKLLFFGTEGLDNPSNFYVSKFGTIMSIKALEFFMDKCVDNIRNKNMITVDPDKEIFKCFKRSKVLKNNYCSAEFKNEGFPKSVREILNANSALKPSCKNNFVAISGVVSNQNQLIEEATNKAKFDALLDKLTKNVLDLENSKVKSFKDDYQEKVQTACESIKQNAENSTKMTLENSWLSGMDGFCQSVLQ